jgi:GT2 family glycosyltransferase
LSNSNLILFIEDDLILDKDCLANLVSAYLDLSASKKIAAVTPRLIEGTIAIEERKNRKVITVSPWTGLVQPNFQIDCNVRLPILAGHACSLISKEAWKLVGGYEERRYSGTSFREETDFYFRARGKGHEIYFEPKAVAYHLRYSAGGCRSSTKFRDDYYYARNQVLFLLRFYKFRSAYMIPIFVAYLAGRLIGRRFRP